MKLFFSLFLISVFSFQGQAQSIEIYLDVWGEPMGEDISGTIIEYYCSGTEDCSINFEINNISGETLNLGVERYKLVDATGSEDYLSFGTDINSASFPAALVTPENPFIAPFRTDVDTNELAYLYPIYRSNEGTGCSEYRYYITDEDNEPIDSVDIHFCSTVGISEWSKTEISVYPNPAQNQITLTSTVKGLEGLLTIYDLTGKIVYSEMIQSADTHSFDLEALDKGIYIISLFDPIANEQLFNTKLVLE